MRRGCRAHSDPPPPALRSASPRSTPTLSTAWHRPPAASPAPLALSTLSGASLRVWTWKVCNGRSILGPRPFAPPSTSSLPSSNRVSPNSNPSYSRRTSFRSLFPASFPHVTLRIVPHAHRQNIRPNSPTSRRSIRRRPSSSRRSTRPNRSFRARHRLPRRVSRLRGRMFDRASNRALAPSQLPLTMPPLASSGPSRQRTRQSRTLYIWSTSHGQSYFATRQCFSFQCAKASLIRILRI